ncbi:MAG TPA: hypothetical protein P5250_00245 [Bacteroidales bacterium]|nr:hypothetical protein [Bacteroidales bacterium]
MKTFKFNIILILLCLLFCYSCKRKNPPLLTNKIEYDVTIKNENNDTEWWVQNLEGSIREKLINTLIEAAKSGKFKVYDYDNNLLNSENIELLFKQPVSYTVPSISDPNVDSVVNTFNEINKNDITKIIFLEQWYFDEKTLSFTKKVLGLGPVIKKYIFDNETGEKIFKGYMPLFWIYLDKDYPAKLK